MGMDLLHFQGFPVIETKLTIKRKKDVLPNPSVLKMICNELAVIFKIQMSETSQLSKSLIPLAAVKRLLNHRVFRLM